MHPATDIHEDTPLLVSQTSNLKGNTFYIYLVASLSAIGGFLFGYDTGIISGAMIFIRDVFNLNDLWQELIVSSTLLAAWAFSILSGSMTDKFGRKPVIVGSSLVFVLGALLMAFAWNALILLIGRLVVGAGVGLASMTVPMYIAEVAPSGIRGKLVMINMCCITGGQFCAALLAYGFSFLDDGEHSWRFMLGFAAIPALIQFFAFIFMPESPRWLISKHKYEAAREVLKRIRQADADTELEFEAIRQNCRRSRQEHEALKKSASGNHQPVDRVWRRVLATQPVRKALLVGCLLQALQQASGINTVMYYTASIFQMAGVRSKQQALLLSAGTAMVNFVFTIVGLMLVERAGRRKLTLISLFGVVIGLLTLATGFQLASMNSPQVNVLNGSTQVQPCGTLPNCAECIKNVDCGFCYSKASQWTTCMPVSEGHHDNALLGPCSSEPMLNDYIWAYEWCPSAYSWLTLVGMIVYLLFFAPGMGPMPWTINTEIYPVWARSFCLSASTSVCWLFNLLVSMSFLTLMNTITKQGTFYLYALLASVGFVYFFFVLPETRGKSLEELEDLFANEQWIQERAKRSSNHISD